MDAASQPEGFWLAETNSLSKEDETPPSQTSNVGVPPWTQWGPKTRSPLKLKDASNLGWLEYGETERKGNQPRKGNERRKERHSTATQTRKVDVQSKRVSFASFLAGLMAAFLICALANRVGKSPLEKHSKGLVSPDPHAKLVADFTRSAAALEYSWRGASETAKRIFIARYTPSEKTPSPLSTSLPSVYHETIAAFRADMAPAPWASERDKSLYALRLQLATAVLQAAEHRLAAAKELEQLRVVLWLPSHDDLISQQHDLVSFDEFMAMLDNRSVESFNNNEDRQQRIPRILAHALAREVLAANLKRRQDAKVLNLIDEVMLSIANELPLQKAAQSSDTEQQTIPMPGGIFPFHPNDLSFAISHFAYRRRDQSAHSGSLDSWAANWTVDGALDQLATLQAECFFMPDDDRRLKQQLQLSRAKDSKGAMPNDPFYSMALALL